MEAIVKETLKEWLGDSWEKSVSEVEDEQKIELTLLGLIKQCMPADEFELFSLVVKIHNNLLFDEGGQNREIEKYNISHNLDDDWDIYEEDFPLSKFRIDLKKFQSLVLTHYQWIYQHSQEVDNKEFIPDSDDSCDTYIYFLALDILCRVTDIKSSIIYKYNEKMKNEALSILNRKWDKITEEDYERAIEMLESVKAYDELIEVLSTGVYIKGENGWKVKRSDQIKALKIEENAVKTDNVTLKDWVYLLKDDYNSGINPENTNEGILEKLYKEGSGLAALILGDYTIKLVLNLISGHVEVQDLSDWRLKVISDTLTNAINYYKAASERDCAIGYRVCSLIYSLFAQKEKSNILEQDYQESPYDFKRSAFNLSRDYNKALDWEKENGFRFTKKYWNPAPLSIIALDTQKAKRYLKRKFQGFNLSLLSLS